MIKKSIIKLPTNKRFNYTPRYFKGKEVHNIYDFDSKFVRDRETSSYNDFRAHWSEARKESRHRGNREVNFRLIAIIAALVLIFFFIIDFDLSIFNRK
jgi:hypothetical protein